jgi:hypothetical protein
MVTPQNDNTGLGERRVTYGFAQFCGDLRAVLKAEGAAGIDALARKLEVLMADPAFAAMAFPGDPPPGKRVLFHDTDSDARVQAHVHAPEKTGNPHSHGASWAIYGTVRGFTDMTEWRRVNPESEDHAVLEPVARYRLSAGQARAYALHKIHSTAHPEKAWVIRIIGTDLNAIPRYRFRVGRDRMLNAAEAAR